MKKELIDSIKGMFEVLHSHASKQITKDKEVPAVLLLLTRKDVEIVQMHEYMDNKPMVEFLMKIHSAREDVAGTIFISEAWIASFEPGQEIIAPSKREDKKEVLIFVFKSKLGVIFATAEIEREPSRLLALEYADADSEVRGRFVDDN
jgi:hypothetical protein